MTPRWLSWLRFLRLPNALTVPGDVLAGAALAGASVSPRAMAATVLAYLFGMALNDCADLPRDRVHRPERPLPSGRIPLRAAWAVAGGLALASLILAWQAAPLLLAIIAYTFAKDRLPLGAPLMGLCRVLSVGMGAWPAAMTPALLGALVLWFAYIALLTHLAEREETPASEGKLPWILATLLALGPLGMLVPAPSPAAAATVPPVATGPVATAPATAASLVGRTVSSGGAPSAQGFIWPASGSILQGFSEPRSMGISISGKPGDPVVAARDGRVIFSGTGPKGYGNLVIVKHEDDLLSVYAHNRQLLVKDQAQVRRGQRIADLGDSDSDRPKLHFEIRRQGKPVDPQQYLPR
jgi:hypothetical protein